MNVRIEIVCLSADGTEQRRDVMEIERTELVMENLGMSLKEGKALLERVQDFLIEHQTHEYLERHRMCSICGKRYTSKDAGAMPVKTLFGRVDVPNPRWNYCACQAAGVRTFRPAKAWLQGRTTPEMLYLETKWASLIPFAKVTDLLKDVLPIGDSANPQTVRNHLQATAERIERELGEERQLNLFEGTEEEWEQQPLPDGPITVGIDGGYVRAAHKQGWFEVIAGKSVVSFRREEEAEVPPPLCFGFVQTYDTKPRRRLWELMKSQGLQENQQVVFMSDGGENVRRMQEYLHPFSEHLLDWFHITMRLTVLQQQTKALKEELPATGVDISKRLESVKHLLWHGNTEEALERLANLVMDLSLIQARSAAAEKMAAGVTEFETYIRNNREFIPNFGERRRHGETISTAFVESTINQVVSRRFVKKQQIASVVPIFYCRREQKFSTASWRAPSNVGIRVSGAKPPDPRLFTGLQTRLPTLSPALGNRSKPSDSHISTASPTISLIQTGQPTPAGEPSTRGSRNQGAQNGPSTRPLPSTARWGKK